MATTKFEDLSASDLLLILEGIQEIIKKKAAEGPKDAAPEKMEEEFTMPAKVTKRKFKKEEKKLELTNGYEKLGETTESEHENGEDREQVSFKKPKIHREQRRSEKRTVTKGQEEPKKAKIAPIFLKVKEKWTKISQKMSQAKISTT
ncbi:hypothetical protein Trydic_g10286, partial [Trypoxylus dichotomus]